MAQTTAYVHKGGDAEIAAFGCNGATAQTKATYNAAASTAVAAPTKAEFDALVALVNQLRLSLINCGIGQ